MAEVRDSLSRTDLFHHGDADARWKRGLIRELLFRSYLGLLPLIDDVDHLADVVLHVRRALQDHVEADCGIRAGARVFCRPIFGRLRSDGLHDHGNCIIEAFQSFFSRRRIRVVEFARPVAHISRLRNLRTDVIVQVTCQVKDEMAKAVSVGERLLPELSIGERRSQFVNSCGIRGIAVGENGRKRPIKSGHSLPHFAGNDAHVLSLNFFC